jgi:hypothetical protein
MSSNIHIKENELNIISKVDNKVSNDLSDGDDYSKFF